MLFLHWWLKLGYENVWFGSIGTLAELSNEKKAQCGESLHHAEFSCRLWLFLLPTLRSYAPRNFSTAFTFPILS